jgi:hypothetical protein
VLVWCLMIVMAVWDGVPWDGKVTGL